MMQCQICRQHERLSKCMACGLWLCERCMFTHLDEILFSPQVFSHLSAPERVILYPSWSE